MTSNLPRPSPKRATIAFTLKMNLVSNAAFGVLGKPGSSQLEADRVNRKRSASPYKTIRAGGGVRRANWIPGQCTWRCQMASGRFLLAAALSLSTCAALPAISLAEDAPQADSGNHVFLGEVNANAVFIHSRASEDAYPTMKVSK